MKSLSDQHPTADDLIPSVRRSVEAARRYLIDHGIVTVPSDVRPTSRRLRLTHVRARSRQWTRPVPTKLEQPRRFTT